MKDIDNDKNKMMKCIKYIALEHHPNDSRIKLNCTDHIQTLTSRMGTGGGNVPLVIEVKNND